MTRRARHLGSPLVRRHVRAPKRWQAVVLALFVGSYTVGCAAHPPTPLAPSSSVAPTGRGVPFALYTHCGIDEIAVGGVHYERVGGLLDDGSRNPPAGWGNPTQHGWLAVTTDRAVFSDDAGHHVEFTRRTGPSATEWKVICA